MRRAVAAHRCGRCCRLPAAAPTPSAAVLGERVGRRSPGPSRCSRRRRSRSRSRHSAKQFEAAHPGHHGRFNFGASSRLARQISQGAPADVFASASAEEHGPGRGPAATRPTPRRSPTNTMEIAVPPATRRGSPRWPTWPEAGVKIALCQAAGAVRRRGAKVFANAGVTVTPVTEELDVKAVLTQGDARRGRRRHRLRHRRAAAGDEGARASRSPAGVNAVHDLPDRGADGARRTRPARRPSSTTSCPPDGPAVLTAAGFRTPSDCPDSVTGRASPPGTLPPEMPGCRGRSWCPPLSRSPSWWCRSSGSLVRAPWRSLDRRACRRQLVEALRLSLRLRQRGHRAVAGVRGAAGLGARPGALPRSPLLRALVTCRWSCRRSSAVSRSCWRSAGEGLVGRVLDRGSGSPCRSPPRASWSPRRSSRCRSSSSPSRARFAPADRDYEEAAATLGRHG